MGGRETTHAGQGRGGWRGILFRCAAVVLAVLPFVLLEGGLRFLGMGQPTDHPDPLSGFSRNLPLFERQGAVYRTSPAREPFFPPQEFPAEKPPHGFRIFCLGGSTVHGHPYQSDTAFPKWLEMELAGSDPGRVFQAVNCGGVSYASHRLAPIVKEVLSYQPDLIIVATGENEFLEDRTYQSLKSRSAVRARIEDAVYSLRILNLARNWMHGRQWEGTSPEFREDGKAQLPREVRTRLDERSGYASYHRDDAWHDRVTMQFEESIRAMVEMCREAGVPIILVKPGSNLRDCPPYKSEHRPGLAPGEENAWQAAFEAATAAEDNDLESALALYRKAEAVDGEYALLAYRIARVLDRLGRKNEALEYYLKARDQDICPLRINKRNEEILSRIAAETKTPLLDAASLLAGKSPDAIPGNNWYLDHVHPTIGGHQKIAQAIAGRMREHKRQEAYTRQLERLGPGYLADGRRRVGWLENWARRERLLDETLPKDSRGYLHAGFRRLDLGDDDGAWEAFAEALKRDGGAVERLGEHAKELVSQGRQAVAKRLWQWLGDSAPGKELPGK